MGSPCDGDFPLERQGSSTFPGPAELAEAECWPCSPAMAVFFPSPAKSPMQAAGDSFQTQSARTIQVRTAPALLSADLSVTKGPISTSLKCCSLGWSCLPPSAGDVCLQELLNVHLRELAGLEGMHCMPNTKVPLLPPGSVMRALFWCCRWRVPVCLARQPARCTSLRSWTSASRACPAEPLMGPRLFWS